MTMWLASTRHSGVSLRANSIAGLVWLSLSWGLGCDDVSPPMAASSRDGGMDAGGTPERADAGVTTNPAADGGGGFDAGHSAGGSGPDASAAPAGDAGTSSPRGDAASGAGGEIAGAGALEAGSGGAHVAGSSGAAGSAGANVAGSAGGGGRAGANVAGSSGTGGVAEVGGEDAGLDGEAGAGAGGPTAGSSGNSAGTAGSGGVCATDHDCALGLICGLNSSNTCSSCASDLDCQHDTDTYGSSTFCDPNGQRCGILCASCGGCEQVQTVGTNNYHTTDPIDYSDPPPTSGPHDPCWARWGVHDTAVPDERWVHNLEHGGVVFLYHCPDGCSADIATLTQLVNARDRTVLTEYDALPGRFAVVAWGHRLIADCVDATAFAKFYTENFDHGAESEDAQPDDSCPP
jgi:hypothetical protein